MKSYEVFCKLSGGSVLVQPVEAEDLEAVKREVLERIPEVRMNLPETHPGEEIEEFEIYELVKVATIDFRPRVVMGG